MISMRNFQHRLVLVRVERQADRSDAGDAMEAEHLVEFAAGGFDPGDQPFQPFVVVQLRGDRFERAGQVVRDREHIAREPGRGISARVGDVLFQATADVLGFGLGVERFLPGRLKIAAQKFQRIAELVRLILKQLFGDACQFGFGGGICGA